MTVIDLSRAYACKIGGPILKSVDRRIFSLRYYMDCMGCNFCHDTCCQYGVDVDVENVERLKAAPQDFKALVGYPVERWFTDTVVEDAEFPSGKHVRTQVVDGACVFRNRKGRGCLIHSYALNTGIDYHSLKPLVSILFPLTFEYGVLEPSNEIQDGSVICYGDGPTVYEGSRDELLYYFGAEMVVELDALKDA
jgi:hypothetical protein